MLDRIKNENIKELATDKLFALQNTMVLDGRMSSYPASARGYSVSNCYLLKQPDAAWLIDTGFGGHEVALRTQIESLIPRTLPLSLLPLRLNEFMSIQNIDPFTLYFNVKECFTGNPDAAFWFDFGAGSDSGEDTLSKLKITTISREETIPIGSMGRPVVVYQAPIRLIATRWIYDEATKTLFTSDMWTHSWREKPEGPWTPIAANLENTGKFEWAVPANVPKRILVRVEAADLVGHVTAAHTPAAILIDRARPTVSILTVEPDKK